MINNRQGGEALINFVASRFKKGGPVAAFQEGGDVDDDYGTFGAEELGASVEDTAASEDIGAISGDRGPDDIDFPDEFEVPDPDKYDYGQGPAPEEPSDSDKPDYSKYTTAELIDAREEILKAKEAPGPALGSIVDTGLIQAELDKRSGRPPDQPVSVTEAATQAEPIDFYTAQELAGERADIEKARVASVADQLGITAVPGAAEQLISGQAPSVVSQAPPAGRIAGAINYTREELDSQQAADGGMTMGIAAAAPPSTVQGPGGPDTAEDVGAVPGLTATIEEMAKQLEVEDLSKFSPPREATPTGGVASLGGALMDAGKGIGQALSGKAALSDLMKGGTPIKSEKDPTKFAGTVTYTTDPVTGKQVVEKVSPTSLEMAFDPALKDAYSDFYANQPEQRDSDGSEPILPEDVETEEEEEAPKKPPTVDIIPFRPQDFAYFTPGNFAYNRGLPSMMNMRKG